MQGGYVAMLDVLGFSAIAMGDPNGDKFHEYLAGVADATKDGLVKYVVFSDTIVLTTENKGADSLLDMTCPPFLVQS